MKKVSQIKQQLTTFYFLIFLLTNVLGQSFDYKVSVNLNEVVDDRVKVEVEVGNLTEESVVFTFPKIVPGTYSIYDFGRFIKDFKALKKDGKSLKFNKLNENQYEILNASSLNKITYWVDDTYDSDLENPVFEPAGTNIQPGKNFIINTHGFFGYLEEYKNKPYAIEIQHDPAMFGASSLPKKVLDNSTDLYTSPTYVSLADEPIMYSEPDTATIQIGKTEVLISVYAPFKIIQAKLIKEAVSEVLFATKNYLTELPVDRYAFLLYFTSGPTVSGAFGALEHSYSSVYSLPERNPYIKSIVRDVAAHEFFHIVTPLNVHSEEIGNFDFTDPQMSKHLWMYEGITEYFAGHLLVSEDVMDNKKYLETIEGKIMQSQSFNDTLPFTIMSKGCLHEHKDQYLNVYQKGALIGMCMDILLRKNTQGEMGVKDLMMALSKKYGKNKSFKDDELFDTIESLTSPEIRRFLDTYVAGSAPLPLAELFDLTGISYQAPVSTKKFTFGNIGLSEDSLLNKVKIVNVQSMNEFGKRIGYDAGDRLLKFYGQKLKYGNLQQVIDYYKENAVEGEEVKVVLLKKNSKGKYRKRVVIKAPAMKVASSTKPSLKLNESASTKQEQLREWWLRPNTD